MDIALNKENVQEAITIFKAVKNGIFKGIVADITILNIDYIARKIDRDVIDYLKVIEKNFTIVGANNSITKEALSLNNRDIEDNIQYILAVKNGCNYIITNDKNFYKGELEVLNSCEFVDKFLKE